MTRAEFRRMVTTFGTLSVMVEQGSDMVAAGEPDAALAAILAAWDTQAAALRAALASPEGPPPDVQRAENTALASAVVVPPKPGVTIAVPHLQGIALDAEGLVRAAPSREEPAARPEEPPLPEPEDWPIPCSCPDEGMDPECQRHRPAPAAAPPERCAFPGGCDLARSEHPDHALHTFRASRETHDDAAPPEYVCACGHHQVRHRIAGYAGFGACLECECKDYQSGRAPSAGAGGKP